MNSEIGDLEMQDTKQMVRWALLLMAAAALVGIVVPNLGFGETLNHLNDRSVQKITMNRDRAAFDRTHCDGSKSITIGTAANFEPQSGRK